MLGNDSQQADPANAAPGLTEQSCNGSLDRRTFLVQAGAVASGFIASTAIAAPIAVGTSAVQVKEFTEIAGFLTGKTDLPNDLVSRAFVALLSQDAGFERRMNTLKAKIDGAGLSDVEAFKASQLTADPDLMSTAMAIVSALYTGRVGAGNGRKFVGYKDALMYRPTADVSVIPTYARWGPGYWAEKPR